MHRLKYPRKALFIAAVILLLALGTVAVASCGGTAGSKSDNSQEKLPPGATQESVAQQTTTAENTAATEDSTSDTPAQNSGTTAATTASTSKLVPVEVAGGYFEVVKVTRRENNKSVVSGNTRQVSGDYFEIELQITNTSDTLLDLSQFSFRLESPGIDAAVYADYYGSSGAYGAEISTNVISATLLDYSSLQQASYTMKSGEIVDSVFLFFDLNPVSTAKNAAVMLDNSDLFVKKVSGTSYGDKAYVNLATPAG